MMGAVKSAFWDEINAVPCELCGEPVTQAEANAEAFEAYAEIICPSCFDNRCEAELTAQFEGGRQQAERLADGWMCPALLRHLRRDFLLKARAATGQAYPMRDPYRRIAADYRAKLKDIEQ